MNKQGSGTLCRRLVAARSSLTIGDATFEAWQGVYAIVCRTVLCTRLPLLFATSLADGVCYVRVADEPLSRKGEKHGGWIHCLHVSVGVYF